MVYRVSHSFMWKCTRSFISDALCTTAAEIFIKPSNDNSGKVVNTNEFFLSLSISVLASDQNAHSQKKIKWISLLKIFRLLFKFMDWTGMFKACGKVIWSIWHRVNTPISINLMLAHKTHLITLSAFERSILGWSSRYYDYYFGVAL